MDFKTGCLFFPLLCATVRHRSLSFCFQLVIQVQPGDSFFLQLCFQEKTKSWHFSKLSIDCLRVGSVSTPSPAAGTLSKKGEIEQNTSQSWCYRPADKQGGTWPWKGMCSTKSKWRYQQNLQALRFLALWSTTEYLQGAILHFWDWWWLWSWMVYGKSYNLISSILGHSQLLVAVAMGKKNIPLGLGIFQESSFR